METSDWTEENQKQCSLQAMKLNYCSLQGFNSVDFTYLFYGIPVGKHCIVRSLDGASVTVSRPSSETSSSHFHPFTSPDHTFRHPWLELSISSVWKVQDITCLIKNIDSNVPAQRENVKHGRFARFTAHCTCRHSTLHHSFWTLRFLSSGQTCANGHAWTTNCGVTHFQHNQIFAHPFLSVSSDIDWLNGGKWRLKQYTLFQQDFIKHRPPISIFSVTRGERPRCELGRLIVVSWSRVTS